MIPARDSLEIGTFAGLLQWSPRYVVDLYRRAKMLLGIEGFGIWTALLRISAKEEARKPMSQALRSEIADTFREDTKKLSRLIDKDLEAWC